MEILREYDLAKTLPKLNVSAKFPLQEISEISVFYTMVEVLSFSVVGFDLVDKGK